ncbi:MAG TPA: MlaE family lipid ABC transporter permease subunit [Burkholderiales bacterium]|nr:MlaE family lipid ABC transporter permease subunit [Burkholderiales bacterium]
MPRGTAFVERAVEDGGEVLYLSGAWRLQNVPAILEALHELAPETGRLVVDGSRLESLDTAGAFTLLRHLARVGCQPSMLSPRGFDAPQERLLALVRERITVAPARGRSRQFGMLGRVGAAALHLVELLEAHTAFVGRVATEIVALVARPRLFRPRETASQFEDACINAVPIVVLVNFLIGVVLAYVLGMQAQRYGANIFVADGIALAVCRELSPILSSVLVAGRSGAAFTAQIGTMKVEEEIDAISTLGLSPMQVLVMPRLVALVLGLPLLVFVGDLAGIAGGMLIGAWQLDLAPAVFLDRVHGILEMRHFVIGLAKAPVFAGFIALIACRMGLTVARDARSVGRNTTSTVVQCIVWVIVLDAAFAVLFQRLEV